MVGGTGQKLAETTVILAGAASLAATLMSIVSIWLQLKNYRKPLLQRYVVRILLMVPIYSISSFSSMISTTAAQFLDPIRDIYEAFTIYTFFQLLINYLGGERSLIIMTHGREPISHLWPLNHVLPPVDISDPHSFLGIKRGILQYAWLKPLLGIAAIVMKATGTYQEGYIGLNSGYFWSGIIYNLSVTVSLYSLGLFWVCMNKDLTPFRPVPKFLCVKLIIFASYWQGFLLSILVFLGALPDNVEGYTPDNLAAAIQDALICIEMPGFAVAHWYAFSWQDYADDTVSAARLPVKYAVRDAFGIRDLIEDSKLTFRGDNYAYRDFDSNDKIMAHADSRSRVARLKAGMRYERGGKGKYWIPSPNKTNNANEPDPYTPLLGGNNSDGSSGRKNSSGHGNGNGNGDYGNGNAGPSRSNSHSQTTDDYFGELALDEDMEELYGKARKLEYGDWNYPVVPANVPSRAARWRTTALGGTYEPVPGYYSPVSPVTPDLSGGPRRSGTNASGGASGGGSDRESGPGNRGDATPAAPEAIVVSKKKKGKGKQKQSGALPTADKTSDKSSDKTARKTKSDPDVVAKPTLNTSRSTETTPAPPISPKGDVGLAGSQGPANDQSAASDDNESLRLWRRNDDEDDNASPVLETTTPTYNLEGDEFRNVWGAGQPGQ
ncbi:uncharacterized protein SPSK_03115 [Sporothrix schenckii 1099-18]|uniref:Uncharacterized protein n=1 Tax=Sporothrix schenckii 1099-18 TaxID=1397361 RepID=A0A0F2M2H5_SPOSC|nr:uncharacterized protein SPSK_03115 [Sporothrix schenckii 1099-18]KJR82341.1 hypothetical protein SPSK_03115 [Sporothrix schenckii 1099-18]